MLDIDQRLIGRVFLASTHREIGKIYAHFEVSLWSNFFREKFFSPWSRAPSRLREEMAEQHLNSAFGCEIFELKPSVGAKEETRAFIEHLLAEDAGNLTRINRFNELKQVMMEEWNPMLEDEELEYCTGRDGRTLSAAQETSRWCSLTSDLGEDDLYPLYPDQSELGTHEWS